MRERKKKSSYIRVSKKSESGITEGREHKGMEYLRGKMEKGKKL